MISIIITIKRFLKAFSRAYKNNQFKLISVLILLMIISGTFFYVSIEKWTVIDSVYFCVMTLSTVGYGDIAPTTDLGKIFTIFFTLGGIGLFVMFLSEIGKEILNIKEVAKKEKSKK